MNIKLGHGYRDKITGFAGVATAHVKYITGCNQVLIAPKTGKKPDRMPDSAWIDEQRLEHIDDFEPIVLDNGPNPGFDAPAPIR